MSLLRIAIFCQRTNPQLTFRSTIPQGTQPQNRLIDGAVGPANPSASPVVPIGGGETDLDVEMAWPIIWPQQAVVYQVDDQWYEFEEGSVHAPSPPRGSFNSMSHPLKLGIFPFSC